MSDPAAAAPPRDPVPVAVLAAVALYAAALVAPALLPIGAAAIATGLAALVLLRRRSPVLVEVLGTLFVVNALTLAGVWIVAPRPRVGLAYVLFVLFLLPLPLAPWLYWRSFDRCSRGDEP